MKNKIKSILLRQPICNPEMVFMYIIYEDITMCLSSNGILSNIHERYLPVIDFFNKNTVVIKIYEAI